MAMKINQVQNEDYPIPVMPPVQDAATAPEPEAVQAHMEPRSYLILDAKAATDNEDAGKDILRITVGIPPQMVRISVKVKDELALPYPLADIKAHCASGNLLRVRFEGFEIEKAWPGFGKNANDGFTFRASKVFAVTD